MVRKQPFTIEEFKSLYSRVPRVTVDLVIKSDKGILLTLREKDGWKGQWHLPGGTIYLGEKVSDTVHRIAKEEVNLEVKIEKLLGVIEYPSEVEERGYGQSISLAYLCAPLSSDLVLDETSSKYDFFPTLPAKTIKEQKDFLNEKNYLD